MDKKTAFVIMPFAEAFYDVYKFLILEALETAGYDVKRADDIKSQNNIISDIVEGIVHSDLIVADLTGSNPNVYYELGLAHGLNKRVILTTQEIDDIPFDLRSYRVIGYDTHFSKMNKAKEELIAFAQEAYENNLSFGNPIKDYASVHPQENIVVAPDNQDSNYDDFGLLDFQVQIEEGFDGLVTILTEVGNKLREEVTTEISNATGKLNTPTFNAKQKRKIVRTLAGHIQEYGAYVKPKNVEYRSLLVEMEQALEGLLNGQFELKNQEAEQGLESFIDSLETLNVSATEGRQGFVSLVSTMEALPKIEKTFYRANTLWPLN